MQVSLGGQQVEGGVVSGHRDVLPPPPPLAPLWLPLLPLLLLLLPLRGSLPSPLPAALLGLLIIWGGCIPAHTCRRFAQSATKQQRGV
jgi:hypothetical protein